MSATAPRRAALAVLARIAAGELVDRALPSTTAELEPRDQAWVRELVYGTLRLRGRLDFLLSAFVKAGLESLDPVVLDVLRLAAYQLVEMGSVPPYAAVSQSVDLARYAGAARAAGLVNGVLRRFNREWQSVGFPEFEADPIGYLETWGSHPRWLIERWVQRWGPDPTCRLVEADNRKPELYLTPVGLSPVEAIDRLGSAGFSAEEVERFPDSVKVLPPANPVEALYAVPAVVQDPAAAAVVRFAAVEEGSVAIDVGAAPGKTIGLAARARYVAAADLSLTRLHRVRENVERVGLTNRVGLVVADGRRPPFRSVAAVLLDAPCTGTGTFRRRVDGRWRVTPADLDALVNLQRELLDASAELVVPRGLLIYATCSLEPEENEEQVEAFLRRDSRFR